MSEAVSSDPRELELIGLYKTREREMKQGKAQSVAMLDQRIEKLEGMIKREQIKTPKNTDHNLKDIGYNAIIGGNYKNRSFENWKNKFEEKMPHLDQMIPYEKDAFINELNGYDNNNPREVRIYHDVDKENKLDNYRETSRAIADLIDHHPSRNIHELGTPVFSGKDYDGFWDKVRNLIGLGPEERSYSSYYSPLQIGFEEENDDSKIKVELNKRDYGRDFIPYHSHFVKKGLEDIYSGPSKIDYEESFGEGRRKGVEGNPGLLYDLSNGDTLLYFGNATAKDVKMDRFGNPIKMNGRYIVINKGNKPS